MVSIRKRLCPEGRYGLKCPFTRTPTRIVVHNTANDAPAENEISYMINNGYEISYHYAVDDKEVVQGLPENRNAWASGDGRGRGNMEGIHIEICYSLSGGARFTAAEKNAAEFIASLLKKYGWGIDRVTKHQDYDGKYCPHRTLGLGWERFINMVKENMKEEEDMTKEQTEAMVKKAIAEQARRLEEENPTYHKLADVPDYWREDIGELVAQGIILGGINGDLELKRSEAKAAVIVKRALDKLNG